MTGSKVDMVLEFGGVLLCVSMVVKSKSVVGVFIQVFLNRDLAAHGPSVLYSSTQSQQPNQQQHHPANNSARTLIFVLYFYEMSLYGLLG